MNESYTRNVIEAALLAAGKSLQPVELAQLFDENGRPTLEEIRSALQTLSNDYEGRGIEIKETAAGFRIQVRRDFANEISRLWPERPAKYSRAMLETLALIAYRQPITRAEIEAVRGVAVNPNILKTMIERNWVRVVGHRDVPGRPELLGTTRDFLEYFGLRNLDDLPPLAEIKTLGDLNMQLELPAAAVKVEMDLEDPVALLETLTLGKTTTEPVPESGAETEPAAATAAEPAAATATELATEPGPEAEESARAKNSDADDDPTEDDELSADGRDSRELVAAPRDFDD